MCGIAGYVDSDGSPPDEALASAMAGLLAHRGPDGTRAEVLASGPEGPTVVFGHRRLAVIDLSDDAVQPLSNEDGTVSVVPELQILHELVVRQGRHSFADADVRRLATDR
jgi:asparagine synthase (glutamine-hydrolysing)